jgi:hypothetical protein
MSTAAWPEDPDGDMAPILEASVEAAKARHPSGRALYDEAFPGNGVMLTADDRCDRCNAAAAYRVAKFAAGRPLQLDLDLCLHHWKKNFPSMVSKGWLTIGGNPNLLAELNQGALDYGQR